MTFLLCSRRQQSTFLACLFCCSVISDHEIFPTVTFILLFFLKLIIYTRATIKNLQAMILYSNIVWYEMSNKTNKLKRSIEAHKQVQGMRAGERAVS